MPELPEVQTITQGLRDNIIGKNISSVNISNKNLRLPFPVNINSITNKNIKLVTRRARYILIHLNSNQIILIHLGMSGKLIYQEQKRKIEKHDHFLITFKDNSSLTYNDPRRFGLIDLVDKNQLLNHKMIKNLGIEPLNIDFNAIYLKKMLKNKKMNIKTAMMDNKIVVGVGNIYINESLFKSRICPLRSACSLSDQELKDLVRNIKDILIKAIKAGGSTLRDYIDLKGDIGEFQFDFKVYGKHNKKCSVCNHIIVKIKQNGRSSFYCKKCQK